MGTETRRTALLRHRFTTIEQLKAHLHIVEARALLFFRDPSLALQPGAPVLIEVAFQSSEQTRTLRATIVARSEGHGLWLAMPNAKFAREVHGKGLVTRKGRRLGADRLVRIKRGAAIENLVTLTDLSISGARLGGGVPQSLARGDSVEMRLAATDPGQPPELGRATVVWAADGEAGVLFDRTDAATRVAVGRLFNSLQGEWERARTVDHLPSCCTGGRVIDPPLPRLRENGDRAKSA